MKTSENSDSGQITMGNGQRSENGEEQFMREAIRLSIENVRSGKGGPFAALVVHDGNIIARGTNLVTLNNDPTAHAEVMAIREACRVLQSFQLDGCDIYTTCEPCPMCLGAIYWARPARIFFGNTHKDAAEIHFDDSFIYQELRKEIAARKLPFVQMLHTEARVAFDLWKEKRDKVQY